MLRSTVVAPNGRKRSRPAIRIRTNTSASGDAQFQNLVRGGSGRDAVLRTGRRLGSDARLSGRARPDEAAAGTANHAAAQQPAAVERSAFGRAADDDRARP